MDKKVLTNVENQIMGFREINSNKNEKTPMLNGNLKLG